MPPVRNNATPASAGSGIEKRLRSVAAEIAGAAGSAAPTQQDAHVRHA